VIEGEAWYQSSETAGREGDDTSYGAATLTHSADCVEAWIQGDSGELLSCARYINRIGIRDYTAELGYTQVLRNAWLHRGLPAWMPSVWTALRRQAERVWCTG